MDGFRKGISFTLTLTIIAVVLLVSSITLLTLFGTTLQDVISPVMDTGTEAQVSRECENAIQRIQSSVCNQVPEVDEIDNVDNLENVESGEIDSVDQLRPERTLADERDCNEIRCVWPDIMGEQQDEDLTVSVNGEFYDCRQHMFIDDTCPVTEDTSPVAVYNIDFSFQIN